MQDLKQDMMDKCMDILVNDTVFKTLELHPKRIYDDSVIRLENTYVPNTRNNKLHKLKISSSALPKNRLTINEKRTLFNDYLSTKTPQNEKIDKINETYSESGVSDSKNSRDYPTRNDFRIKSQLSIPRHHIDNEPLELPSHLAGAHVSYILTHRWSTTSRT